jgi:hypothetical protein
MSRAVNVRVNWLKSRVNDSSQNLNFNYQYR